MKAKLIVEGKEFEVDINNSEFEELIKPEKKTGYERVDCNKDYYIVSCDDFITSYREMGFKVNKQSYEIANYYSDETVAENNARADKLMRQLRRFAVEHRKSNLNWGKASSCHYVIYYNHAKKELYRSWTNGFYQAQGAVYFDSEETAKLAIETFRDELIWYFTEYKDSL